MAKITKRQRSTLREIDKLMQERKHHQAWGFGAIVAAIVFILIYNLLVYQLDIIHMGDMTDTVLRALLFTAGVIAAAVSGINFMKSSQKQRKIDGFRQASGISMETLNAWRRGEIE